MTGDSFETNLHDAIRRIFPELPEDELSSAVDAFVGYIDVVNDIYDTLAGDPERSITAATLTAPNPQVTVEAGHAEPSNQLVPPLNA